MEERIDSRRLMKQAAELTGLNDFGEIPFKEALAVLVDALESEAKLDDARRAEAKRTLVGVLAKRLMLTADRNKYPEIAKEIIKSPIFIVGLPRTGSTNLHGLIAQCEGVRAPRLWEMAMPSPPPTRETYETDPRIQTVHKGIVGSVSDELMARHPIGATRPEQCNMLSEHAFMNWALMAAHEIPSYRDWLLTADHGPAYEAHRQALQHLQWRHPGQWVLKYPKHLFTLDALLAAYPDAKLIWTHRDPGKIIPSVVSLIEAFRKATPGYDPIKLGRSWAPFEELGLLRGLATRDHSIRPEQIIDVHYRDVLRDPIAVIEGIFTHFGMALSDSSRKNIRRFVSDNPQTKHGVHTYSAEQFGLEEERIRTAYRSYMDRFNITDRTIE